MPVKFISSQRPRGRPGLTGLHYNLAITTVIITITRFIRTMLILSCGPPHRPYQLPQGQENQYNGEFMAGSNADDRDESETPSEPCGNQYLTPCSLVFLPFRVVALRR